MRAAGFPSACRLLAVELHPAVTPLNTRDQVYRVRADTLRPLAASAFRAAGSTAEEAGIIADHLVEANLVGHDSHGVIRLSKYIDWHANGAVLVNKRAVIVRESPCHALVDGEFGFGQVIGRDAMNIAIDKAGQTGMCMVSIRNAGHLGRIGAWAEQVAAAGFASVHFVNTSGFGILVAPFGGADRRLSANPIAAGTPGPEGYPLILDMSTSAIAEGKIQLALNQGKPLPEGCTIDAEGRPNRDPAMFYGPPAGALLPVGEHKGYGLSIFCEVLAGALSGGQTTNPANATSWRLVNNMLSIVFDPEAFCGAEPFAAEIERMAAWVKASPPATPGGQVLLPGELERRTRVEREREGIPLDPVTRRHIAASLQTLGVTPPPGFTP